MNVADELGRIRREAGLTQEALASRLSMIWGRTVSQGYVTKLETGKRRVSFEAARDWAAACNCRLYVTFEPAEKPQMDPLVHRAAVLLPYASPDVRQSIVTLLETVTGRAPGRSVR